MQKPAPNLEALSPKLHLLFFPRTAMPLPRISRQQGIGVFALSPAKVSATSNRHLTQLSPQDVGTFTLDSDSPSRKKFEPSEAHEQQVLAINSCFWTSEFFGLRALGFQRCAAYVGEFLCACPSCYWDLSRTQICAL